MTTMTAMLEAQRLEAKGLFDQLERGDGKRSVVAERLVKTMLSQLVVDEELLFPVVAVLDPALVTSRLELHAEVRLGLRRLLEQARSGSVAPYLDTLRAWLDLRCDTDLARELERRLPPFELGRLVASMRLRSQLLNTQALAPLFVRSELASAPPLRASA